MSHAEVPGRTPQSTRHPKVLWVREPYLSQILAGLKSIEVRVAYQNIRRLQAGCWLKLNDRHLARIERVGRYTGFEELLAHEDAVAISPDLTPQKLLAALRELYPPEKEALGAVALEITPRRYDAVLFDLGHTLVYFDPPETTVVQAALHDLDIDRSLPEIEAALQAVWGIHYEDAATATFAATPDYDRSTQLRLAKDFLSQLGLTVDDKLVENYEALLDSRFSQPGAMRSFPEVTEVLAVLQDTHYRLGIVSNWSWNLRERVAQVELDTYLEIVWASAYAGCNKPHPGIFFQALVQMDLSARRTLYVGDSYRHDVVGARNAGLHAVLLDRTGTADAHDCPVIQDLRGLLDFLRE
jgi:putative hydrolase of the HAD superfamily